MVKHSMLQLFTESIQIGLLFSAAEVIFLKEIWDGDVSTHETANAPCSLLTSEREAHLPAFPDSLLQIPEHSHQPTWNENEAEKSFRTKDAV